MADTYTPNLNLKKPGYDSPADIEDINSNMDKIDTSVNQLSQQIADEWDAGKEYKVGAFVKHNGLLWKCEINTVSEEPQFVSSCWKQVKISDEVLFRDLPCSTDDSVFTNGNTTVYSVGDVVIVNVNVNFILSSTPSNSMLVKGLPKAKRQSYAALCLSDGSTVRIRIMEDKDCVVTDGVVSVKGWSNGQIVYIKK